jgi:UDP-N-acetylglucosamine 1-carboxyvinyltransferase
MDKLTIQGPVHLSGQVEVSSAKNAALPILAAVLLCDEPVILRNLPHLTDISTMIKILERCGVKVTQDKNGAHHFDASSIHSVEATYDEVKTMRASIVVLGPLLSRFKKAKVSLPGGCAIGARPIDMHLEGLKKLGAHIILNDGSVEAYFDEGKGAVGNTIVLPFPSVGATENLMCAAVFAEGKTIISNAAEEPEVEDLGNFLNAMGAKVVGHGTHEIHIEGVKKLHGATYDVIPDRIEAATYIIAGIITNSPITIKNVVASHLRSVFSVLEKMGAQFRVDEENCVVEILEQGELQGVEIDTAPYPGVPTDVQAQLLVLSTQCQGRSVISEHIFENRYMHVPELNRMGANILLRGNSAIIQGKSQLKKAPVMCTDLRASAALVLASLICEGETVIDRVYHLDRGYSHLDEKLKSLGVTIYRTKE